MKHTIITTIVSCHIACAATITTPYENPGTDGVAFAYEARATFSLTDSWITTTSVGGWSYVDLDPSKNQNRGWGHSSSWFLIQITSPTVISIMLDSANIAARPGFVLYSGESVEDLPALTHRYSNNGIDMLALNAAWDKNGPGGSTGLGYIAHAFHPSGSSVSSTFAIAPGLYTLAVGNGADSRTNPVGPTLNLTLHTIPEPSATVLGLLGACTLLRRRR